MVRFIRSAKIASGKQMEAVQWAGEIAAYINEKFSGPKFHVFNGMFGEVGRLIWMNDHENLAALEKFTNQILADEAYWAIAAKGGDLLIEGSVVDDVISTLR